MARHCHKDSVLLPVDSSSSEKAESFQHTYEFYSKEELASLGVLDGVDEDDFADLLVNDYLEADEPSYRHCCSELEEAQENADSFVAEAGEEVWVEVDEGVFRRVPIGGAPAPDEDKEDPGSVSTNGFFIDDFSDYDIDEEEEEEKRCDIEDLEDRDWTMATESNQDALGGKIPCSVDELLRLPFDEALLRVPKLKAHIEGHCDFDVSVEATVEEYRRQWGDSVPEDMRKVITEIISDSRPAVPNVDIDDFSDYEDEHVVVSSIGDEYSVDWSKV